MSDARNDGLLRGNGFRYRRRVQFAETDPAGLVHFSWFLRYMEEAEHALWRAAGLCGAPRRAGDMAWPRVSVSCEFSNPLFFEDEFDVWIAIEGVTRSCVRYAFRIVRGETIIGTGRITAACVYGEAASRMKAMPIPDGLISRLHSVLGTFGGGVREVGTAPPAPVHDNAVRHG